MKVNAFNFESLTVYQKSLDFSHEIYLLTKEWPREYLFGLTDQIRRASLSIVLNIAEGSSRTKKDFAHFLQISRGSCFECIPILELAMLLKILDKNKFEILYNQVLVLSKMLSSLRSSLTKN
jgi:four helix bundle protein